MIAFFLGADGANFNSPVSTDDGGLIRVPNWGPWNAPHYSGGLLALTDTAISKSCLSLFIFPEI